MRTMLVAGTFTGLAIMVTGALMVGIGADGIGRALGVAMALGGIVGYLVTGRG